MLILLSPAKTLNFEKSEFEEFSIPSLLKESEQLIKILKKKKKQDLMKLMGISENLAEINAERYKSFSLPFNTENAKQALLAFAGDVYDGLDVNSFIPEDLFFAQKHLRILSGLYGVLKPLDLMQPYRLEMGTSLVNSKGKNLYKFWSDKISKQLNAALSDSECKTIVNLASNEYWSSVDLNTLKGDVIEIQFKEKRGEQYKVISFNAKRARGMMARYAIKERITDPQNLKNFSLDNYSFNETMSKLNVWVFTR